MRINNHEQTDLQVGVGGRDVATAAVPASPSVGSLPASYSYLSQQGAIVLVSTHQHRLCPPPAPLSAP